MRTRALLHLILFEFNKNIVLLIDKGWEFYLFLNEIVLMKQWSRPLCELRDDSQPEILVLNKGVLVLC
jgi:hypothetical protein